MKFNGPRLFRIWVLPLLSIVLPTPCRGCGEILGARQHLGFCSGCWAGVGPLERRHRGAETCAATWYAGTGRGLLLEAKFGTRVELFRPLAFRMVAVSRDCRQAEGCDLVVPVPSHPLAYLRRGFNPARELARHVASELRLPLSHGGLRRRLLHGATVKRASRVQRRRAVLEAFAARPSAVRGARVLLVDDVLTTGATVASCRSALLAAGASGVRILVWARTPSRSCPSGGGRSGRRLL